MKEYLLLTIAIATALDLLIYFSDERFKDISKGALGLILCLSILAPLPGIYKKISGELVLSVPETLEGEDVCLSAFEEGVSRYISEKWELKAEDVQVEAISFSREEMKAEKILVTLSRRAVFVDYKRMEKELSGLGIGEVEVKIEI